MRKADDGEVLRDVGDVCMVAEDPVTGEVDSQNRRCLVSDVMLLKDCPHFGHLICKRQLVCIRL